MGAIGTIDGLIYSLMKISNEKGDMPFKLNGKYVIDGQEIFLICKDINDEFYLEIGSN